MKNAILTILGIAVIVLTLILIFKKSDPDKIKERLNQIGNEDIQHAWNQDSAFQVIQQKEDSLKIAYDSIKILKAQRIAGEKIISILTKEHEKIKFIQYSDSDRYSELKKLYPSMKKPVE